MTQSQEPPTLHTIGEKRIKYEFAGTGALIQLVGFVLMFWFFPIGLFPALALIAIGSYKSKKILCSECGNNVENTSTQCPHCKVEFKQKSETFSLGELNPNGRSGRLAYFKWNFGAIVTCGILTAFIVPNLSRLAPEGSIAFVYMGSILIMSSIILLISIFTAIRRFHDLGMSGWHTLGKFIPVYNLYLLIVLLFKEGNEGENRFGLNTD